MNSKQRVNQLKLGKCHLLNDIPNVTPNGMEKSVNTCSHFVFKLVVNKSDRDSLANQHPVTGIHSVNFTGFDDDWR